MFSSKSFVKTVASQLFRTSNLFGFLYVAGLLFRAAYFSAYVVALKCAKKRSLEHRKHSDTNGNFMISVGFLLSFRIPTVSVLNPEAMVQEKGDKLLVLVFLI